jgi:predicted AlkP superfamily pyrophosphatase or phosphodiesterase
VENATVMLVADHGMAPIHSVVYVNTILEQAGLLTLDRKNYVIAKKTKAFAVASGGSAHIYINLADHEKDGFVSQEAYPEIQQTIINLLQDLVDPVSGEKVFQRVLAQDELSNVHLDHLNAGDVFAQAYPGYHLDGWRGNNFVFEPANFYGQHGYASSLPEMHAIFIAAGAGVTNLGGMIPPVQIVDYAPSIAKLLGFTPASSVDGSPIPGFRYPP